MSRQGENLIGQKFFRLTVLEKDIEASKLHKRPYWRCQCDCGKEKTIAGLSLKNGATKSCGCLRNERVFETIAKNEIGNTYGKLTVVAMDNNRDSFGRIKWICQCACGNQKSISGADLRSGNTQSCGCHSGVSKGENKIMNILDAHLISYIREYRPLDLGQKRFDFAILDDNNNIIRLIEFDGEQHYKESKWGREKLSRTQESDKIKNEYAQQKNIPLVRIPYWELQNIDFNLLFSDKYLLDKGDL